MRKLASAVFVMGLATMVFAGTTADSAGLPAIVAPDQTAPSAMPAPADRKQMLTQYCTACHNDKLKTAGMSVAPLDAANLPANLPVWEKILRRLSLGEMPPKGRPRPSKDRIAEFTQWLSTSLDANALAHPNPGRIAMHRLNRVQYANAVRDLLDLDVDFSDALPADDSGYGFDDIAALLTISPTLIDRYVTVAAKVGRLATGQASRLPVTLDHKIEKDGQVLGFGIPAFNERTSDELPLGSRGGGVFHFYAPYDATYAIQLYLNPNTVTERETNAANRVEVQAPLKAGLRVIGASFQKQMELSGDLLPRKSVGPRPGMPKTPRVPLTLTLQVDGAPIKQFTVPSYASGPEVVQGFFPRDVVQISVNGPTDITGSGDTPSRRRIFLCHPSRTLPAPACARKILASLARHAFRRPVDEGDTAPLMKIYAQGARNGGFEHGVESALEAILVSPNFLLVHETDPARPGVVHKITDLELATRLSLFLWSSIPDEELLTVAQKGRLSRPDMLQAQVARMLRDPKAQALTRNFAGQWLYLRKLDIQRPDHDSFPDFSQPLRAAMRTETEMFFTGMVQDDRSILDFLAADYTYLNERLARHYGIKGVHGDAFRLVRLDPAVHRGGLLGQGSILTVTSYNNRTSVVLRGKWILENILGAPPPPPPPNVPALNDAKNGKLLTVREQMELHRKNPVCASCHTKMDPLGFSLENYDATGAWRGMDAGKPLDVSAVLPDGTQFAGPQGLQTILMARKEQFVETFIEMMMTYALGRGIEAYDMPAIRAIRHAGEKDGYRMQDIILGVVKSLPFTMRKSPDAT